MACPFLDELKKHAASFLKEKIQSARLALMDVTQAQLLTEEATDGDSLAPDAMKMNQISRAAFEIDDYCRIVDVLHKRLAKFGRQNWREAYSAVKILEHLLTHGPLSASQEFQCDRETMEEMCRLQYVDEKGFDWGLSVRNKTERVLKLLEGGHFLKQERDRVSQISCRIQGFGCQSNEETTYTFEETDSNYKVHAQREGMTPLLDWKYKQL